jgi:drug/metabolite transporter (DMT)-like permease
VTTPHRQGQHAPPFSAYLYLAAGMSVVGAYVGFSKVIVATVPVFLLATIRFGIAAIAMLPWTFPTGGMELVRKQARTLVAESVFGNFLFSICMLSGVARTSATAAGLIMSMLPATVAVFSLVALGERLDRRTALAVLLAVIGVGSLTIARTGGTPVADIVGNALAGNAFMVGAVCCEAIYVVLGKRLTNAAIGPMQISAWINLVGFTLMLPFGVWQGLHFDFGRITVDLWLLIALYAIAASVLSTWLWLTGLKHVPAGRAGVFTTALPITSALVGIAFLDERPTLAHGIAFACAVVGIVLVTRRGRTTTAP